MTYLLFKTLHVLAAIIFLGNILTGLFWAEYAHHTRDFNRISFAFNGIIRSDRYFTMPGVNLILIGGFGAAYFGGFKILGLGWILWSIVLFVISGVIFMTKLVPLQRELAAFTRDTTQTEQSWTDYEKMFSSWKRWGYVALATPFAAAVIMVLKPDLPGL